MSKKQSDFAPEAGFQRLRNVINKGLTEEDILHGAGEAFKGGWNQAKLYFYACLPTETEDDTEGDCNILLRRSEKLTTKPKKQRKGKVQINVSTSFFCTEAFTPFQWVLCSVKKDHRKGKNCQK